MKTVNKEALQQLVDNLRLNADKQIFGRLVRLKDDYSCELCADGVAVITFAALNGYDYSIQTERGFDRFVLSNPTRAFEVAGNATLEIREFFFGEGGDELVVNGLTRSMLSLNDHLMFSFNKIADIIENQYLKA